MTMHWIVYLLTFTSTSLLVLSGYNYWAKERKTEQLVNRRLAVMETTPDRYQVVTQLRRERGILEDIKWSGAQQFNDWLVQTGLRLDRMRLFLWAAAVTGLLVSLVAIVTDFHPAAYALGIAASAVVLALLVRYVRARRIAKFQQQLPDVIDVIIRGLKAGHPLATAFSLVAKETSDPAGTEFGVAFDEISFGLDVPTAIRNLWRRVGDPDLLYFVTSIAVQSQSGGNLAEILARLAHMLRERSKLRLKVLAMTAEGRMTAILLTLLPVVMFGVLSVINPKYYGDVWNDTTFRTILYVSGVLLVIGNVMMRRMVNFKY